MFVRGRQQGVIEAVVAVVCSIAMLSWIGSAATGISRPTLLLGMLRGRALREPLPELRTPAHRVYCHSMPPLNALIIPIAPFHSFDA
jgi:hypothetical protein